MIKKLLVFLTILISIPTLTYAIFLDTQKSSGNTFAALTLNTKLTPSNYPLNLQIDNPTNNFFSYIFENIGTTTTSNNVYIKDISNQTFSELINVEVELNETTLIYSGPLNLLNVSDFKDQIIGQADKLGFVFTLQSDELIGTAGEEVTFTLVNHSWQESLSPNTGFFDNESIDIKIKNETVIERSLTQSILDILIPDITSIDILDEIVN